MTEIAELLKMIEEVDPNDNEKLDEIDARVWCLLNNQDADSTEELGVPDWTTRKAQCNKYTRSRDALKGKR